MFQRGCLSTIINESNSYSQDYLGVGNVRYRKKTKRSVLLRGVFSELRLVEAANSLANT